MKLKAEKEGRRWEKRQLKQSRREQKRREKKKVSYDQSRNVNPAT